MRDPRSRDSFPRETWLLHLLSIDIAIYANKLFLHINDWSDPVLVKRVAKKKHPIAVLPFLQAANRIHRSRLSPSISLSRDLKKLARLDKNDLRGDSFFYYRESFTHISHLHKRRAPRMRVYSYTTFSSPLLLSLSISFSCSGAPRRCVRVYSCLGLRQSRPVIGAC